MYFTSLLKAFAGKVTHFGDVQETPHKHIPEEVWQLVARHLNIKEWAQASGTCKATWTLQLSTTVVTNTPRGLCEISAGGENAVLGA